MAALDDRQSFQPALHGHLDAPAPGASIYDAEIFFHGWVFSPDNDPAECRVRAFLDDDCVAETRLLFPRADVCRHLALSPCVPTGFRMLGKTPAAAEQAREATLRLAVSYQENTEYTFVRQNVRLVPAALETRPYGPVVHPDNATLLHRANIYGSGPPVEEASTEAVNLILNYLPPGASVIDVGCGAGAYGAGLVAAGHEWLGLETNPHCWEILRRRRLPFREVDRASRRLLASDSEFDCAICVEVLEHIAEPERFAQEIARVTRSRALFSVPNIEVLPYLHDWAVVPWHLLEADHKNFFTRTNLRDLLLKAFRRVEIFPYGEHLLKTRDGIPVYTHLFAVAEK